MSWENTIKKEDGGIEEFIEDIELTLHLYKKTNKVTHLKVMKNIVEDEIKRRVENYPTETTYWDDDVGENEDGEV